MEKQRTFATIEQVVALGKIPRGSVAVFKNGKKVELSGPPLDEGGKSRGSHRNYEKFINPTTKTEDTIGVLGPFITNKIGVSVRGLDHFLVPKEAFATTSSEG